MKSTTDERPPWEDVSGWPFASSDQRKDGSDVRQRKLDLCVREALDCDQPILESFSTDVPSQERLEAVTRTLVLFLESLEDGVVTEELWTNLEAYCIAREKDLDKRSLSAEDEKLEILDIMTKSPAHSTAFTFVTGILGKVVDAILETGTSENVKAGLRQKFVQGYSEVFVDVLYRPLDGGSSKERAVRHGRWKRILEIFI